METCPEKLIETLIKYALTVDPSYVVVLVALVVVLFALYVVLRAIKRK